MEYYDCFSLAEILDDIIEEHCQLHNTYRLRNPSIKTQIELPKLNFI